MATLGDVNNLLAACVDNFRLVSFDGSRLLVVVSFDLSYYHDVEVTFVAVESIRCPVYFTAERFCDAGPGGENGDSRRFEIIADGETYEIVARGVEVQLIKVYYYDRGKQLKPGERMAPWVKRRPEADGGRDASL